MGDITYNFLAYVGEPVLRFWALLLLFRFVRGVVRRIEGRFGALFKRARRWAYPSEIPSRAPILGLTLLGTNTCLGVVGLPHVFQPLE